jgi:hypothetical protein
LPPYIRSQLLAASPSGKYLAWCLHPNVVAIGEVIGTTVKPIDAARYTERYQSPDGPLSITGLAFLDDDHLAIALDAGRGDIVDLATKSTSRFDPHAGDAASSWLLMYGGKLLT